MFKPLISVITVCRNNLPALQQTAASVKEQTFTDYEYIIVDGASTDQTVEWLQTQKGVIWISEPDQGIYDAMNKGVRMAKGRWVIFMNAGDTFYSQDVLAQVEPYLHSGNYMVYGDIVKERNGKLIIQRAGKPRNAHRMICCHQALFTQTRLLRATPFDISHPLSADFKFCKQMFLYNVHMRHLPIVIARFDTHGVSHTHLIDGLKDNIAVILETDARSFTRSWFIFRLQCKIKWTELRQRHTR